MIRILQVLSCLEYGGTEAFVMNHYRKLDRTKCQFDFYILNPQNIHAYEDEISDLGGRIYYGKNPSVCSEKQAITDLCDILRKNGPYNGVHSHVNSKNAWIMYAAKKAGVLIRVSHSHAVHKKETRFLKRLLRTAETVALKQYATDFLACSNLAGESLYGTDFFHEKGKVIHNGIDLNPFFSVPQTETVALRNEFSISDDCPLVLGNITRFDKNKNQIFAMEVFYHIVKKVPKAIFLIGGPDGGEKSSIERYVKEKHLEKQVRFIGIRTDIPSCLSLIDIYIFPSIEEGLGIALLEAQAARCICYSSDTIPASADVGLKTVSFLNLNLGAEGWAEQILRSKEMKCDLTTDTIRKAFADLGYMVESSLKELLEIYERK